MSGCALPAVRFSRNLLRSGWTIFSNIRRAIFVFVVLTEGFLNVPKKLHKFMVPVPVPSSASLKKDIMWIPVLYYYCDLWSGRYFRKFSRKPINFIVSAAVNVTIFTSSNHTKIPCQRAKLAFWSQHWIPSESTYVLIPPRIPDLEYGIIIAKYFKFKLDVTCRYFPVTLPAGVEVNSYRWPGGVRIDFRWCNRWLLISNV